MGHKQNIYRTVPRFEYRENATDKCEPLFKALPTWNTSCTKLLNALKHSRCTGYLLYLANLGQISEREVDDMSDDSDAISIGRVICAKPQIETDQEMKEEEDAEMFSESGRAAAQQIEQV